MKLYYGYLSIYGATLLTFIVCVSMANGAPISSHSLTRRDLDTVILTEGRVILPRLKVLIRSDNVVQNSASGSVIRRDSLPSKPVKRISTNNNIEEEMQAKEEPKSGKRFEVDLNPFLAEDRLQEEENPDKVSEPSGFDDSMESELDPLFAAAKLNNMGE